MMALKTLKPHRVWRKAIVEIRQRKVVYSLTKMIDAWSRESDVDWETAYDYVEYNLFSEQVKLGVIIDDDLDDDDTKETLDYEESDE
jgi:hypothetical protein